MPVEMKPVSSSNVSAVGYEEATQTLYVTFNGGGTYSYDGVPKEKYLSLLSAPSIGKFINSNIKPAHSVKRA